MKKVLVIVFLALFSFSVYATAAEKININTATATELVNIKGVGDKTAEKIVKYREEHGKFKSMDSLTNVKGVGAKVVENNKDKLTVE